LGLSRKAAQTDADVIVFCGVDFMAETAKILSPEKTVIIPSADARCPMAAMITPEELKRLKLQNPGVPVVSYINTPASIKAMSHICCTSANAVDVINSFDSDEIIFTPDKHLAAYVQTKTKKRIIPWHGYCPTHVKILPQHIIALKKLHPKARVAVHPECRLDVIQLADTVASTEGMVRYVSSSPAREFIIGTETAIIYRMRQDSKGRKFYPATELARCPNMKKITMNGLLQSLQNMEQRVNVPENIIQRARNAINRMLEMY
jgi:quinolinate synthase